MADPTREKTRYESQCINLIRRYVARTDGHAFVLFTSYDMMRRVAQALTPWLIQHDLGLYSQSEGLPRSQMLERFKQNPRAVLLGTDSFWQGIDVKGEALSCVIIDKLPFQVPSDPLVQARIREIEQSGGNGFADYQVPAAILRLKQGFGRLIRSRTDKGVLAILDSRLKTRGYGKLFLSSLPDYAIVDDEMIAGRYYAKRLIGDLPDTARESTS